VAAMRRTTRNFFVTKVYGVAVGVGVAVVKIGSGVGVGVVSAVLM
jgi:hypothetical protein